MAQAVSRRLLTAETEVLSQAMLCGGFRLQSVHRTLFYEYFHFPLLVSLRRMPHTHISLMLYNVSIFNSTVTKQSLASSRVQGHIGNKHVYSLI
jgi:hypothetical protein